MRDKYHGGVPTDRLGKFRARRAERQPSIWQAIQTALVIGVVAALYADPQVPGMTAIANPTGAFQGTVQTPPLQDQFTLALGGGGIDLPTFASPLIDDGPRINQLLAANPGETFTFVSGQTYTIGTSLLPKSDSTFVAFGATIKLMAGAQAVNCVWANGISRFQIYGGLWDGNFSASGGFNVAFSGGFALPSTVTGAAYGGAGATSAPTAGTIETWTVTGGNSAGYFNGCVFQIGSANSGFELVLLESGFGTNTWNVMRGVGFTATVTTLNGATGNGTVLQGQANHQWDLVVSQYGVKSNKNYIYPPLINSTVDGKNYLLFGFPIRITNCTSVLIDGAGVRNSRTGGIMVDGPYTGGYGLTQTGSPSTDVIVSSCRIRDTVDNGIFFYQVATGVTAIGNVISDLMYSGVAAVTSTRVTVVGNQIRNTGPSPSDSTGIEIAGAVRAVVADNLLESCNGIAGILFTDSVQGGGQIPAPVSNSHISGNVITACNSPTFAFSSSLSPCSGVEVQGGASNSLVNNRITYCDQGILVDSSGDNEAARDTIIKGNAVEFNISVGVAVGVHSGSHNNGVTGTTVDANSIRFNGGHGGVDAGSAGWWKNNIITDNGGAPGVAPNTNSDGIYIDPAPTVPGTKETWIVNNVIADNRNNGVEIDSGFQSTCVAHIIGNQIENSAMQQYFDGCLGVDTAGVVSFVSPSAVLVSGDATTKVGIDAVTGLPGTGTGGGITATLTTFKTTTATGPIAGGALPLTSATGYAGAGFVQVYNGSTFVGIYSYTSVTTNNLNGATLVYGPGGTIANGYTVTQFILGSLSTSTGTPNAPVLMTACAFVLYAGRKYMSRGLFVGSAGGGPFELIDNRINNIANSTPNTNIPTGSVFARNFETNNANFTPDHASGTSAFATSTTIAVVFAKALPTAPSAQQLTITPTQVPAGVYFVSAISATGFTLTCGTSGSWTFGYSVDLAR